jgi:hypothetical protein
MARVIATRPIREVLTEISVDVAFLCCRFKVPHASRACSRRIPRRGYSCEQAAATLPIFPMTFQPTRVDAAIALAHRNAMARCSLHIVPG